MGILYPISDRTRLIRMIYYTLSDQREWKSLKNIPLGRFTLYRPLVHGSISFLDSRKTKHLSVETRWNSSLLGWKRYYLGRHCFKSVAFELLTRAGHYLLVGLLRAPKCFHMLFCPVCLSFSVFSSQPGKVVFKRFHFHFLVLHVAPEKVRAWLYSAGVFPFKSSQYPKMYDVNSLPIYNSNLSL